MQRDGPCPDGQREPHRGDAKLENELKSFKARMNAKRFGTKLDVDSASMDDTKICQQYFG